MINNNQTKMTTEALEKSQLSNIRHQILKPDNIISLASVEVIFFKINISTENGLIIKLFIIKAINLSSNSSVILFSLFDKYFSNEAFLE